MFSNSKIFRKFPTKNSVLSNSINKEEQMCEKVDYCKQNKDRKEWKFRQPACVCKEILFFLNKNKVSLFN